VQNEERYESTTNIINGGLMAHLGATPPVGSLESGARLPYEEMIINCNKIELKRTCEQLEN
jgi:hypothetical protein